MILCIEWRNAPHIQERRAGWGSWLKMMCVGRGRIWDGKGSALAKDPMCWMEKCSPHPGKKGWIGSWLKMMYVGMGRIWDGKDSVPAKNLMYWMEKCSSHPGKKSWMGILFEDDVCWQGEFWSAGDCVLLGGMFSSQITERRTYNGQEETAVFSTGANIGTGRFLVPWLEEGYLCRHSVGEK